MLLTKDLIDGIEEKYIDMLRSVNIPDFTKCISVFSGLEMNEIDENMIKEYLHTWAKNKYKFYQMLGNRTNVDMSIEYKKIREGIKDDLEPLCKDYPAFFLWFDIFSQHMQNKISKNNMNYNQMDLFNYFCNINNITPSGMSITHFFKKALKAPDDLVTKIASIFENDMMSANYTISIDPIDIMTASENPYDWQSCYRLETDNCESHADGCMAALLDTSSMIAFIWKNSGKMKLYEYELKDTKYKMMRQWVALSEHMTTIYFNSIYPGKSNYTEDFEKVLRGCMEEIVSKYLGLENKWKRCETADCDRAINYGYGEFGGYNMYVQSQSEEEEIIVYNVYYNCACGCGQEVLQSDSDYHYNGCGFQHNCMSDEDEDEDEPYCAEADQYCEHEYGDDECKNCVYWIEANPKCSIDGYCEDIPDDYDYDGKVIEANEDHCSGCPRWAGCHSENNNEE